jgi:hypothetical protein
MGSAIPRGRHGEKIMTKNQAISAAILANIANGMDLPAAYDAVFGEGAYLKMTGEIYDALRAKAGV